MQFLVCLTAKSDKVTKEKLKAKQIINKINNLEINSLDELIESKYLVIALYFSDNYIQNKLPEEKTRENSSKEIIKAVSREITTDLREKYIYYLDKFSPEVSTRAICPVDSLRHTVKKTITAHGIKYKYYNHQDALDLFDDKGDPVRAHVDGIVLLSENEWVKNNPLSVASVKGGNSIITYNKYEQNFYRYAHFEDTTVEKGEFVEAGQIIGTIGISGDIAFKRNRPHLHLEINHTTEAFKHNYMIYYKILEKLEKATQWQDINISSY